MGLSVINDSQASDLCSVAVNELRTTGKFSDMSIGTDEDEHSIEMHLPYVRKVFEGFVDT